MHIAMCMCAQKIGQALSDLSLPQTHGINL